MNGWRSGSAWKWAKEWATLFETILPADVCETAMATCCFHFRGKEAHRKNAYAMAVHTEMQTFGHAPTTPNACQIRRHWVQLTSIEAADAILACFGLSINDVFDEYGTPDDNDEYRLDLCDVVCRLYPDFVIPETVDVVAVAV